MASYEQSAADVITSIENSGLSDATKAAITDLLAGLTDVSVANIQSGELTNDTLPADAQLIVMGKDASANVTLAADSPVKAMVVGGAGNSNVVFQTSENVAVQLGGGENDSVATGAGDDTITFAGGSATINTGAGDDHVVLTGEGSVDVTGGDGNMVISLDTTNVAATVDAGDGFDQLTLGGTAADQNFTYNAATGQFVMQAATAAQAEGDTGVSMQGVNIVTFTNDAGIVTGATVLATNAADALTASLYQVALGRSVLDSGANELGGIEFWQDQFAKDQPGSTLQHTAYSFLNCQEFHNKYKDMSDQQYVETLFKNLNDVNNDADVTNLGGTVAQYVAQLASGGENARYDVAIQIAQSAEAVQILGNDGAKYVITPDDGIFGGDGLA